MNPLLDQLTKGATYRFTYVQQSGNGQWYRWTSAATYLGQGPSRITGGGPELMLSYRPLAGTSNMPSGWVEDAVQVDDGHVELPKRQPGAVQAPIGQ